MSRKPDWLDQFMQITNLPESQCRPFYKFRKIDEAIDAYYRAQPSAPLLPTSRSSQRPTQTGSSTGSIPSQQVNRRTIDAIFDKYRDKGDQQKMGPDGVLSLLRDSQIDHLSINCLFLAYKCAARQQAIFTRDELVKGFTDLGCDNVSRLASAVANSMDRELREPGRFKHFYLWTFDYGKETPESRTITMETAFSYWELLLSQRYSQLPLFLEFIETKRKAEPRRGIPKDTWAMVLEFTQNVNAHFDNYDVEGAWPVLLDEFVGWARERLHPTAAI